MPSKAAAGKLLETPGSRQKRIESIKLFLFIVPCLALVFVFHYMPLWGWIYAFFQYKPGMALANCKFVGFQNFTNLFGNPVMRQNLFRVLRNTLGIQFINYLLMPVPMLFAISSARSRAPASRNVCRPSPRCRTSSAGSSCSP